MQDRSISLSQLPADLIARVDDACRRFESDWRTNARPRLVDYLVSLDAPEYPPLLRELILLDVHYRRLKGDAPREEEYAERFPDVAMTWLADEFGSTAQVEPPLENSSVHRSGDTISEFQMAPSLAPGGQEFDSDSSPSTSFNHSSTPENNGRDSTPTTKIRCPQCFNPIHLEDKQSEEMLCPGCGSSFRVRDAKYTDTTGAMKSMGKFQLLERLGLGGFGAVWKARDTDLDRIVALKIPHTGLLTETEERERFQREARAAAQLRHPNIASVHEVATLNGLPVIVGEFVAGVTLKDLLDVRRLTFRQSAALIAQVADGLDYAHSLGVVHRDIKPANLMLARGPTAPNPAVTSPAKFADELAEIGKPMILDFGLALRDTIETTMTMDGHILGTPAYMSPEQAAGQSHKADRRSDVYSLGVAFYHLLTAELPFRGSRLMMLNQVLYEEPRPPRTINDKIPRDLETICLKCMRKEPSKRYASAAEFADELRRYLREEPILARPVGRLERTAKWVRRNKGLSAGLAAAVLALLVGTAVSTWQAFVARGALGDAEKAQHAESAAKQEALYKLWGAYHSEASARRLSGRRGQRFDTLKVINAALKLPVPPGRSIDELRNEAIGALCLPDVEAGPEWNIDVAPNPSDEPGYRNHLETVRRWNKLPEPKFGDFRGEWLSPDHRFALVRTADSDRVSMPVRLWRLDGSKPRPVFDDPGVYEMTSAFRPDSRQIALGHPDGSVSLYDTESGEKIRKLETESRPFSLAYHPSLPRLAVATEKNGVVIFDLGGEVLWRLPHPASIFSLAWRPDGRRLATGCEDGRIYLWDVESGQQLTVPWKSTAKSYGIVLAFNCAGDRVVNYSWGFDMRLWDANTGRELLYTNESNYSYPNRHHYPDINRDLLVPAVKDKKLNLLRVAEGQELRQLYHSTPAGNENITIDFHPDGRLHAFGNSSGLGFLNLISGEEVAFVPLKSGHSLWGINLIGAALWTHSADAIFRWPIRKIEAEETAYEIGPPEWVAAKPTGVVSTFDNEGQVLAIPQFDKGTLVILRDKGNRNVWLQPQYDARVAVVSPNGRWVATGSHWGQEIKIWEASSGQLVNELPRDRAVYPIGWSPDSRWLITSLEPADTPTNQRKEDYRRLWEAPTWEEGGKTIATHGAISWHNDVVVDGQSDGVIRIVQISTGKELARLASPEKGRITSHIHPYLPEFVIATGVESGIKYVYNLHLIRRQLADMGLDWDGPPFATSGAKALDSSRYTVRIDAGQLAK